MTKRSGRGRVVDWSAVAGSGLIAGTVFLLFQMLVVPHYEGGNAWVVLRLLASPVLGEDVLAPPATFHGRAIVAALLLHYGLSLGFAALLAVLLHRWGLLVGVVGGAMLGLALYCINYYSLTFFFPWFFAMRSVTLVIGHAIFGALAGGIYEGLEVDEPDPLGSAAA